MVKMDCHFITDYDKQLYSVFHEPIFSKLKSDVVIVLCYPLGQEYIRCHKLYVNLANTLCLKGYNVIRFDYHGTGDSSGTFDDFSIPSALNDIHLVVEEFKSLLGLNEVVLAGVRLGATLALLYSKIHKYNKVVLWHPVSEGKSFLNEIQANYKAWLGGSFTQEKQSGGKGFSCFGFHFPQHLSEQISSISLKESDYLNIDCLFIDQVPPFNAENVTFEKSQNKEFWHKRDNEKSKGLVPVFEINRIIDWLNVIYGE